MRQIQWIVAQANSGSVIKRAVLWLLLWPLLISVRIAG